MTAKSNADREWLEAVAEYSMARDDGTLTEAHRQQVRATWLAINHPVELSDDQQALMDEVMRGENLKRVPTIEELLAPDGVAKERWGQYGRDAGYDFTGAALHDTHGLRALLHFHFSERTSRNEADRFFADLASAGLPAKDPVAVLKKKMDADIRRRAARREAPNRRNLATWIILAWNARRQGRPLETLPSRALGVAPVIE